MNLVQNISPHAHIRQLKGFFKLLKISPEIQESLLALNKINFDETDEARFIVQPEQNLRYVGKRLLHESENVSNYQYSFSIEHPDFNKDSEMLLLTAGNHTIGKYKNGRFNLSISTNPHNLKEYFLVAIYDKKTKRLTKSFGIVIDQVLGIKPYVTIGVPIQNIFKDKNFVADFFERGFRELGGITLDENGEIKAVQKKVSVKETKDLAQFLKFFPKFSRLWNHPYFTKEKLQFSINISDQGKNNLAKILINGHEVEYKTSRSCFSQMVHINDLREIFTLEHDKKIYRMHVEFRYLDGDKFYYWLIWNFDKSDFQLESIVFHDPAEWRRKKEEFLETVRFTRNSLSEDERKAFRELMEQFFP
jgi:hypothetical protein